MNESTGGRLPGWHATTILMVRKGARVVIGGDGQVSVGDTVMKGNARKVRRQIGRASCRERVLVAV